MVFQLRPGDILLYHPVSFRKKPLGWVFGQLISIKTWHRISHVEIYDGLSRSWAARDGVGFNRYPTRLTELRYVLRPEVPLDLPKGRLWGFSKIGTPYGWLDLLEFTGLNVDAPGMVCSPAAASFLRHCGWNVFPTDPTDRIAPFQFLDLVEPGVCSIAYDLK